MNINPSNSPLTVHGEVVRNLLKMKKFIQQPLPEPSSSNHANFLGISCTLVDSNGFDIPKVLLKIEWRDGGLGCNEKYTLFQRTDRWQRIFQIEVYPKSRISHRENGIDWFGSHVYYNGVNKKTTAQFDCGEQHRKRWFERFCRHTNIHLLPPKAPYQARLWQ